tara:strand:- start:16823 stop:17887 length:1065 start_codon:yes stop_codon:yes gene_type:complete
MQLNKRIQAFVKLGDFMSQFSSENYIKKDNIPFNDSFFEEMTDAIQLSKSYNGWFTENNVQFAFKSWEDALNEENLLKWTAKYDLEKSPNHNIAMVLAGNIPLVGFHDFLSVLISGNRVIAKLSSNDKLILPFLAKYLIAIEPEFENKIVFTEGRLENFDAVIATGSNNTARYFEYYFGKYPNIIRKNRNSVTVLSGNETSEELINLSTDIFRYFGLGCRNVSKLFIPKDYNFDAFFNAMFTWKEVINDNKYINNYDYNKAVYLMSNINLLDNEFLLLKEDPSFSSPISVTFYEYYDSLDSVKENLIAEKDNIQCIVSNLGIKNEIKFGETQKPRLWDYADNIDTLDFLIKLSN